MRSIIELVETYEFIKTRTFQQLQYFSSANGNIPMSQALIRQLELIKLGNIYGYRNES